jgi:glycosyltransferase involved in cell wall biosynthesis
MTLVSIITPSFNQAAYLEQTICSVIGQDYPHIEYFVVDGGSSDGSVGIISQYADKLAWWVSERDAGQAEAINKGLRRAQGGIVAWLNSDDVYQPGAIARAVAAFERNPDAGLVYGNLLSINSDGQPFNLQTFKPLTLNDLMAFNIIGQPTVFMRREVLAQAGELDSSYHFLLDHHLWLRMASLAPLVYIPETLAAARFHAGAKNVAQAARFGEEAFRLVRWMEGQSRLEQAYRFGHARIWAGVYRLNGYYLIEGGKSASGLASYGKAFMKSPQVVIKDWKRVALGFFDLLKLGRVRDVYAGWRRKRLQ